MNATGWSPARRLLMGGLAAAALLMTGGCTDFKAKNLAKSDISLVADAHLRQIRAQEEELLVKLYRRNPRELAKAPGQTIDSRLASLKPDRRLQFEELGYAEKTEAMLLAFDDRYTGDRVFALMAGLVGMIRASYGDREEFFMLQSLDQQALYNSARNIEILSWRLRHRQGPDGKVYLLTTGEGDAGELNLSFERIFGKMIVLQDMMATIAADANNRAINLIAHGVASLVFLPVP